MSVLAPANSSLTPLPNGVSTETQQASSIISGELARGCRRGVVWSMSGHLPREGCRGATAGDGWRLYLAHRFC